MVADILQSGGNIKTRWKMEVKAIKEQGRKNLKSNQKGGK